MKKRIIMAGLLLFLSASIDAATSDGNIVRINRKSTELNAGLRCKGFKDEQLIWITIKKKDNTDQTFVVESDSDVGKQILAIALMVMANNTDVRIGYSASCDGSYNGVKYIDEITVSTEGF